MSVISKKMRLQRCHIYHWTHNRKKWSIYSCFHSLHVAEQLRQAHFKSLGYNAKLWNTSVILNNDASIWVLL